MTEAGMTLVDAARECRESSREVRLTLGRFSDTMREIERVLALFRDAVELLNEGEPDRALARVRAAAALMGCEKLH